MNAIQGMHIPVVDAAHGLLLIYRPRRDGRLSWPEQQRPKKFVRRQWCCCCIELAGTEAFDKQLCHSRDWW